MLADMRRALASRLAVAVLIVLAAVAWNLLGGAPESGAHLPTCTCEVTGEGR